MGFKMQKKVYEVLDMGTYAVSVKEVRKAEGDYGEQVVFVFRVEDSESEAELMAWASATYSNKSKPGRWVTAILGNMPDELDSEELIGKPCRITVLVKTKDDGSRYNRIDEVLPAKRKPKPEPELEAEPETAGIPF